MVPAPVGTEVRRVSVASDRLQVGRRGLGVLQMLHYRILPHGYTVRSNVGQARLIKCAHRGRGVDWLSLSAHVEARRRALTEILGLRSLVGARVFVEVRRLVEVVFSVHGCQGLGFPTDTGARVYLSC